MKRIITLTGHKYCGKSQLANDLARNSAVGIIYPFTDKEYPPNVEDYELDNYHHVSVEVLDTLIEKGNVLCMTQINGIRWVFFEEQLDYDYNILILDDYAVAEIKGNWDNLYTIKVYNPNQVDSDRVGVYLFDHEFDEVFHYGSDDIYELEWRIENE